MEFIHFSQNIPVRENYDVIVAGGGVAGTAAALSAARHGKSVLLLEKSTMLGGLATMGLINFFVPMCDGNGKQIIFGMAEEFLRLSIQYGYDTIPENWQKEMPPEERAKGPRYMTCYSPYILAMQFTELLHEAGVTILFDCNACRPVMNGTHCSGIITDSKSGLEFYGAKMVIDTTGDCDVLRRSGMPTVTGQNYFTYIGRQVTLESCRNAVESGNASNAVVHINGGSIDLYGHKQPENVPLFTGTTVESVSDYLIRNQLLLLAKLKETDRLSREVTTLPAMPQFRTTCRINGDYTLREEDKFIHFEDSVAAINDFDRRDFIYEVPYRTMIRSGYDNLITAGRSVSGVGYAWDVLRVIPPAIITGQAAGNAVCLAIDNEKPVYDIDVKKLQKILESENVTIHYST